MKIQTSCAPLDALLNGGVESDTLTEFYGEGGSGKTNICLQLSCGVCRSGKKVIYVDTEGVSMERLSQIAGADFDKVMRNLIHYRPHSLTEQADNVEKAINLAEKLGERKEQGEAIGLLVLDSATLYHRLERALDNDVDENKLLVQQLTHMLRLARRRDIPVVFTNQVYTNTDTNVLMPLGGQAIRHISKAIIKLEKLPQGRRRAIIVKHRSLPEGASADFTITEKGIE